MTGILTARELALRLDLRRYPRSFRGRCPVCDYAGGTFSVRQGKSGWPLLHCANGCDRDALRDAVERALGGTWKPPEQRNAEDESRAKERKRGTALRLWSGAQHGHPVIEAYLTSRGLRGLSASPALRYRADSPHPEERGRIPAMLALVQDVNGKSIAIHRTFLRRDGSAKAEVEPQKATLGPYWGGAVRLDPLAPELAVAEGIETAASAGRILCLPAWSALSAGNLAMGLVLPPEVRSIVVVSDNDSLAKNGHHPGQEAALAAARRWQREGRVVRIAKPNTEGHDFNDLLLARKGNGHA